MGTAKECQTVVAVFDTRHRAEGVSTELRAAGYHDAQIGTVAPAEVKSLPESQPHDAWTQWMVPD